MLFRSEFWSQIFVKSNQMRCKFKQIKNTKHENDNTYCNYLSGLKINCVSREANWFSASQKVPQLYWTLIFLPCSQPANEPEDLIVRTSSSHIFKIRFFRVIFPLTLSSSKWLLSFRFSHQNTTSICPLSVKCHMSNASHPLWIHRPNICWGVQLMKILKHSSLQPHISCSLFDQNISLTCSSLSLTPNFASIKTTGKITYTISTTQNFQIPVRSSIRSPTRHSYCIPNSCTASIPC
jgi:hypothetical protein